MTQHKLSSAIVALSLVVIAISGTAAAVDLTLSGDSVTASPGSSVDVTFTVTNNANETRQGTVRLNTSSLPSSWSVSDVSGTDPNPQDQFAVIDSGTSQTFSDIDAGETVTVTASVSVPTDAAPGDQRFVASLEDSNGDRIGTAATDISVTSALSLSGNQVIGVKQGEVATVSLTASNDGTETKNGTISINESTIPDAWTLSGVTGNDPNPEDSLSTISSGSQVVYTDIDAGEDVTYEGKLAVPNAEASGKYNISVNLSSDGSRIQSSIITVAVSEQNPTAKAYNTNGQRGIQTQELVTAVDDFREGKVDPQGLIAVIKSWRNST